MRAQDLAPRCLEELNLTDSVQYMLNLMGQAGIETYDKLALCEVVRQMLACKDLDSEAFEKLIIHTSIIAVMSSIFKLTDASADIETTVLLKDKALNVCANLAVCSSGHVEELLQPKYELLAHLNRVLEGHE